LETYAATKLVVGQVSFCFYLVIAAGCGLCIARRRMMVLVKEVALEQRLSRWIFEMHVVFFDGFCVFPFLIINMILVKVFTVLIWDVRSSKSAFLEALPVEVFEPRVRLDLVVAVGAKSA